MSLPLQPNRRWWIYLLASAYVLTLCFNASQEAFGPADSGLRYTGRPPDHRPLEVAEVVPRSPMQQAGVRAGDVIEAVGGRIVVGQTDWFLARAHFERDKPIEIQVRRGQDRLHLSFTIGTPNWRTLSSGEIAFQATRVFVLLLAIVIALARPEQLEASLVALMFAMIAVAEAFPPTGWAASLRQLPVMLSIPIALASVSWLLITVPWVSLSVRFPQRVSVRPWFWRLVLSPLIIFVPLIMMSAATVVYDPAALAMPSPFLDSVVIRRVQSIWGVMPSLFINPWPFYTPARQNFLLELWVGISILAFATGFVMFVVNSRAAQVESRRHKSRGQAASSSPSVRV